MRNNRKMTSKIISKASTQWTHRRFNLSGRRYPCVVVATFVRYDQEVATVTLTNVITEETLEITGTLDQPFFVFSKGFVVLGDLEIDDVCISPDGSEFIVTGIIVHEERQTVYNFEVESSHTYYVGLGFDAAVLVHNTNGTSWWRGWLEYFGLIAKSSAEGMLPVPAGVGAAVLDPPAARGVGVLGLRNRLADELLHHGSEAAGPADERIQRTKELMQQVAPKK